MDFENGGEQPANDAVVTADTTVTDTTMPAPVAANDDAGEGGVADEGGDQSGNDDVEVDYEGQKFKVPPSIKDALLRQADYTRKTQELAEVRRALEAKEQGIHSQTEVQKAAHKEAVRVAALDERLAEYDKVDWNTLYNTNPDLFHQHKFARDQIKEQRETAARALEQKQGELQEHANREIGNRVARAQAELPKLIKDWSPELDVKLGQFGTANGLTSYEMQQATLQNPHFAKILHMAFQFDEAAKKQKSSQTFQQSQQAKPVTRVGANSGGATRKTTDASGDALSTEEWARREEARLAAKRAR